MSSSWFRRIAVVSAGVATLVLTTLNGQEPPPAPPPGEQLAAKPDLKPEPGIEVQDSGVVHEAFAQPGAAIRGPGVLAPKAPPPAIPELPPEAKPAGENVVWVPGYWHWDASKKDFLWISGFWRNAPDGREWQAGEWIKEGQGYRFVSGHWKRLNAANFQRNLPKPPDSIENGPSTPAPHKDSVWVPGHWEHRGSDYAWRGGYWGEAEDGVMWTPPQYYWTPSGYCYNSGYWDYCFEDRGLLYAPVYFTRPLWLTPGWCYRPSFAINVGLGYGWGWGWGNFYNSLCIGPGYGNYFFGSRYCNLWGWGAGFRPWTYCGRGYYNPVYRNYCHLNKGNANWQTNLRNNFAARTIGVNNQNNVTVNNVNRVGGVNVAGRPGGGTVANRDVVNRGARGTNVGGSSSVVQPARQVLASQQAARKVQVTPGGVSRTPAVNVTRNDAATRLATGQGRTLNAAELRNRTADLSRTQPFRGNLEGRTTLPGQGNVSRSVDRINPPVTRGTLPGGSIDRGTRSMDTSALGRGAIERSMPSSRSLGSPSMGRGGSSLPSGGSRAFNPPSSGGRSAIGGGGISGGRGGSAIGGGGFSGGRGGSAIGGSRGGGGGGARGGRR